MYISIKRHSWFFKSWWCLLYFGHVQTRTIGKCWRQKTPFCLKLSAHAQWLQKPPFCLKLSTHAQKSVLSWSISMSRILGLSRFSMLFSLVNLFKNLNLCTSYIKQIMNVVFHSSNGTNILIRWKMKCTIQIGFASLNGTLHHSPHENICTITLINIHYLHYWPFTHIPSCILIGGNWNTYNGPVQINCAAWTRLQGDCAFIPNTLVKWWRHVIMLQSYINKNQGNLKGESGLFLTLC